VKKRFVPVTAQPLFYKGFSHFDGRICILLTFLEKVKNGSLRHENGSLRQVMYEKTAVTLHRKLVISEKLAN